MCLIHDSANYKCQAFTSAKFAHGLNKNHNIFQALHECVHACMSVELSGGEHLCEHGRGYVCRKTHKYVEQISRYSDTKKKIERTLMKSTIMKQWSQRNLSHSERFWCTHARTHTHSDTKKEKRENINDVNEVKLTLMKQWSQVNINEAMKSEELGSFWVILTAQICVRKHQTYATQHMQRARAHTHTHTHTALLPLLHMPHMLKSHYQDRSWLIFCLFCFGSSSLKVGVATCIYNKISITQTVYLLSTLINVGVATCIYNEVSITLFSLPLMCLTSN